MLLSSIRSEPEQGKGHTQLGSTGHIKVENQVVVSMEKAACSVQHIISRETMISFPNVTWDRFGCVTCDKKCSHAKADTSE